MYRRFITIIVAVMMCFSALGLKPVVQKDVSYYNGKDKYALELCKLDVYVPESARDVPVVVWFHGGGLTRGKKSIPGQLRSAGYIVVAPDYRLMPKVPIDSCIDDAARAVAWVFANAEKLGGSRRRIFVSGHSAGGYLTSMIGLDRKWLKRYGVDSDSIAGLIPYSGQMITHVSHRNSKGIPTLQPTVDEYAPLFHVRKDAPPFIMITGDAELELNGRYEENVYMSRMMKLTGHPDTQLYKLDGYSHGDMASPAHHILRRQIDRICKTR